MPYGLSPYRRKVLAASQGTKKSFSPGWSREKSIFAHNNPPMTTRHMNIRRIILKALSVRDMTKEFYLTFTIWGNMNNPNYRK
jgi:hypothetical protein